MYIATCVLILQWGKTPLYVASEHGHVKVVELLITVGANVNIVTKVSH